MTSPTRRTAVLTSALLGAGLALATVPATAAPSADPALQAKPSCRAEARTVAAKKLRTPAGAYVGKARLTYDTIGDDTVVCAVGVVAKAHRRASTLVSRTLLERSEDGADLGRAMSIQRATQLTQVFQSASFVPTGNTFVLKAKVDTGRIATSTVRYTVP